LYPIRLGQVAVGHHALATDEVDTALDDVHWYGKPAQSARLKRSVIHDRQFVARVGCAIRNDRLPGGRIFVGVALNGAGGLGATYQEV
jgi:hypothetical protein